MIKFESQGNFNKLEAFLSKISKNNIYRQLENLAAEGVKALSSTTPSQTGKSAESWSYTITRQIQYTTISWNNNHVTEDGTPVVILLQYGHVTGTGGYVQGEDFINPTMKPIFDKIANDVWKVVQSA